MTRLFLFAPSMKWPLYSGEVVGYRWLREITQILDNARPNNSDVRARAERENDELFWN